MESSVTETAMSQTRARPRLEKSHRRMLGGLDGMSGVCTPSMNEQFLSVVASTEVHGGASRRPLQRTPLMKNVTAPAASVPIAANRNKAL